MICDNPILIGGSGSTGSTLLATILNRHPEIAIGPELSLFNKPIFYHTNYNLFKDGLLRYLSIGTSTKGWHLYWPTMKSIEHYGWDSQSLLELSQRSSNSKEFSDGLFEHYLKINNKNIWGEKTPSNSYQFDSFLKLYPRARIIHIVRDSRDVVSSLKNRGMNSYYASMLYLYNTAMGLRLNNENSYQQISYEDLVDETEDTLANLCNFLKIDYFEEMIVPQKDENDNCIKSWNNKPSGEIKPNSVGKYKNKLDNFDYFVMKQVKISKAHIIKYDIINSSMESISGISYDSEVNMTFSIITRIYYIFRLMTFIINDWVRRLLVMIFIDKEFYSYPGGINLRRLTK